MSIKFLAEPDKSFALPDVRHDTHFFVATERTALADLLWELKNAGEGLSLRKMAERSGGAVSVSTLHDVMSGKTKSLTDETVTGLAKILNVSEARVIAAHNGRPFSDEDEANEAKNRLWEMYSDIPSQCQKDVMDLLAVLQKNHSVSVRREKRSGRMPAAATIQPRASRLEVRAGGNHTPRTIPPLPPSEVIQLAREGNILPHELLGFARTLSPDELSKFVQELSPDELSQFGLDQLLKQSEAENPPRLKTG